MRSEEERGGRKFKKLSIENWEKKKKLRENRELHGVEH